MAVRLLILLAVLLGSVSAASAAVVRDGQSQGTCASCSSLSVPHSVTTGTERVLVVDVAWFNTIPISGVTVTYAGGGLTFVDSQTGSCGGYYCGLQKWRVIAPASGTANIVVNSSSVIDLSLHGKSYTGVDQTTPLGTPVRANGSSAGPSMVLVSDSTQVIDGAIIINWAGGSLTPTGGASQITGLIGGGGFTYSATSGMPGTASTTYGWANSSAQPFAMIAVPVLSSAGGGSFFTELLRWTDRADNESLFRLQWKHTTLPTYTDLSTFPPDTQQYTVQYTTQTARCYRIRAENSGGNSSFSNELCSTVTAAGPIRATLTAPSIGGGLSDAY